MSPNASQLLKYEVVVVGSFTPIIWTRQRTMKRKLGLYLGLLGFGFPKIRVTFFGGGGGGGGGGGP